MVMDLKFNVTNQIITRTDTNKVVNWSDDYLRLCFDFKTDDWTGTSKFILIHTADDVVFRWFNWRSMRHACGSPQDVKHPVFTWNSNDDYDSDGCSDFMGCTVSVNFF